MNWEKWNKKFNYYSLNNISLNRFCYHCDFFMIHYSYMYNIFAIRLIRDRYNMNFIELNARFINTWDNTWVLHVFYFELFNNS